MAYLPGERPLVYPWQNDASFRPSDCDVATRSITVKRDVSGPGSAYVEWGNGSSMTKVIAVVKGPTQQSTLRAIFEVDVSFTSFASIIPNQHDSSKEIASYIKEGFEGCIDMDQYPQCAVSVFVKVIECGECIHTTISACILAAVEACAAAGIASHDSIICLPVGVLSNGEFIVNPSTKDCATCSVSIGMTVKSRQVVFIHATGTLSKPVDQIDSLVNLVDGSVDKFRQLVI